MSTDTHVKVYVFLDSSNKDEKNVDAYIWNSLRLLKSHLIYIILLCHFIWPAKFSNDWIDFQKTLSSLELPRAVNIACGNSNMSVEESIMDENQERADSGVNNGSGSVAQFHGRPRHKVHDPARDLSIQVLEKFSLVTKFARETTSQLFRENQSNEFSSNERRTHIQTNLDHPKKSSNVAENIPNESPVVSDPLEVASVSKKTVFSYKII